MKRDITFEEISDGKRYRSKDFAEIFCNGCTGCSECCNFTDDTILLDPYDIYCLEKASGESFETMLGQTVNLRVVDGVITPYLTKNDKGACTFLDGNGRCSIHDLRPGFCRLFPLGRIYNDDGSFDYFIQVHECPYPCKTPVKITDWLGIDNLDTYESFIRSWHELTGFISDAALENADADTLKYANMKMLNTFFVKPYNTHNSFYNQYRERLGEYMACH